MPGRNFGLLVVGVNYCDPAPGHEPVVLRLTEPISDLELALAQREAEFIRHWEASYSLPMMGYPVLNRIEGGVQHYLQKRRPCRHGRGL